MTWRDWIRPVDLAVCCAAIVVGSTLGGIVGWFRYDGDPDT